MRAIARFASPETNFGPLSYLNDTYVSNGLNGWNLMVVPQRDGNGGTSFLVMMQQLYETQVFTRVGAPVPNRGGEIGVEKLIAVKYNQTAAENVSKNILHEEVGMWIYQTPSGTDNQGWSDMTDKIQFPILRQGVIPHGNSILLAGDFESSEPGKPAYPATSASYLPVILTPGVDQEIKDAFLADYKAQVVDRFQALPKKEQGDLTPENFYYPTTLLEKALEAEAGSEDQPVEFLEVINLHANSENAKDFGGVISLPFAHKRANPISFDSHLSIQVVKNNLYNDAVSSEFDEVPNFFQLQYFQNIPIQFEIDFMGQKLLVEFPHYQLNTLVKV